MTFRELLKEMKKKAKTKGLLDAEIDATTLHSPWTYRTFIDLIDPVDGEIRHLEFGYVEPLKRDGIIVKPVKVIFRDR